MKTGKEFFDRLQNDQEFAEEVSKKATDAIKAGADDPKALWIGLAAEYDYEVTAQEMDEITERYNAMDELSAEELGKVSGGLTPTFLCVTPSILTTVLITSLVGTAELTKDD